MNDTEVRLAQARRADEDEGPALGDEAFIEITEEDLPIELGTETEVEVIEGLLEGEGGVLEPPAQLVVLACEEFFLQQAAEEIGVGHLALGGAIEPVLMDLADAGELELGEHLLHGWPSVRRVKPARCCE